MIHDIRIGGGVLETVLGERLLLRIAREDGPAFLSQCQGLGQHVGGGGAHVLSISAP